MNMDENLRVKLLDMPEEKIVEMAEFCNKYPNISLEYNVDVVEDQVQVNVHLTRDQDDDETREIVVSPYYPKVIFSI
jgi:pre-mRNA-splicing helicase BRR2